MLFAYLQFKYKMMSEISQVNKHNKLRDTPQNFKLIQVSNPLNEIKSFCMQINIKMVLNGAKCKVLQSGINAPIMNSLNKRKALANVQS